MTEGCYSIDSMTQIPKLWQNSEIGGGKSVKIETIFRNVESI